MAVRDASSLLVGLLVLFHTCGVRADLEVNMEDRVEVFRGEAAQITCMFVSEEGIGGLTIQLLYVARTGDRLRIYREDTTMKSIEPGTQFTDRISVNSSLATGLVILTIDDVQVEDQVEFICLIKSLTEGVGEGRTHLKVFERPDLPTIDGVQTGISVHEAYPSKIGTCEVKNGFPKPNITWYRNTKPLRSDPDVVDIMQRATSESTGLFSVVSELSMKVVKENKDDEFYCEISYFVPGGTRMTETSRINITLYYPSTAVSVWVESPKGKIKEGDSIELQCIGDGNDPSAIFSIIHLKNGTTYDGHVAVLSDVTRGDSGTYQCTSQDTETFQVISGNTTVFVNYLDSAVVEPENITVKQSHEVTATCNALSSLPTQTVWLKDGKEISKGHTLRLNNASFDTAGTYVCVVTVPEIEGMATSEMLFVNVQGPPEILEPQYRDMEAKVDTMVDLRCRVRGFPAPAVVWATSDGKVLKDAVEKETEMGFESVLRVKVTSDITAFCNVSNQYGTDSVTFNIMATTHTTPPATTTSKTTTTTTSTTTTATISSTTATTKVPSERGSKGGNGVTIAVIIICILLLAILGSVLYFLYKKGKICGRSGKKDLTKEKSSKDNIVVEMKSDNTEEAVLLGVNGEKQPPGDQGHEYLDLQK